MEEPLVTGAHESLEFVKPLDRYRDNFRKRFEERGVSEEEYLAEIVEYIQKETGRLADYQLFFITAALSGRRVEWTQARSGSHYHIVGLPCSICGRR